MKIIICGGGPGGLATYHAIRRHFPSDVELYEAYTSPTATTGILGGGLGLAANGQRVISALSPDASAYISDRSFLTPSFFFRNEKGRLLGEKRFVKGGYMMAARAVVHEALLLGIGQDEKVHWGWRVVKVTETEKEVQVEFENGGITTCDLLIAADGVHSICRKAIFGNEHLPRYDGLTGIGGFLPLSVLSPSVQEGIKQNPVTMTFSRSGLFGVSRVTSPKVPESEQLIQWWSTFEVNPPPERNGLPADIKDQLLARHSSWKSPYDPEDSGSGFFHEIINKACDSASAHSDRKSWLVLPRYMIDPLPTWTSLDHPLANGVRGQGRVILLGDAAHPVPPDSGQGVSCAFEDAQVLALLMKNIMPSESKPGSQSEIEAIGKVATAYQDIRVPRIARILRFSKQRTDGKRELGFFGEKFRDLMICIFCNWLPESVDNSLFGYDAKVEVEEYLTNLK